MTTLTQQPLGADTTASRAAPIAAFADQAARIMMALIFILAGYAKIGAYDANLAYMASFGVPGLLLPAVIALELIGGTALVLGYRTRITALLLAGFSVSSALLFHADLGDQMQFISFFKNLAMAGGLLALAVNRPGPWTIDRKLGA